MNKALSSAIQAPPRFNKIKPELLAGIIAFLVIFIHGLIHTELFLLTPEDLTIIPMNIFRLVQDMVPPSFSPLKSIGAAILETFQMAMLGTVLGALVSIPLSVLAASNITPNVVINSCSRTIIAIARTVPDLVWALFFVIIFGLGPLAGALTLFVDTIGFAGRFFAVSIEEIDNDPRNALLAIGATSTGALFSSVFPLTLPSFINTTLFSLERAVQSSVLLGFVGAGGIGMLLEEPMTWHNYDQAATVVLSIFLMLYIVEQISAQLRNKLLAQSKYGKRTSIELT